MASSLVLRSNFPRALAQRSLLNPARSAIQLRHESQTGQLKHTPGAAPLPEFRYVPGGPIYQGDVNTPTPFPTPSRTHGSYHWAFERLLSAGLIPMTVAAFATSGSSYPILDGILGISLIIHSHIGFDSMLVDYLHKRKFPVVGPIASWTLRAATVGVMVGVYQFNTNDIGLTELIAKVWTA
ncbi:membrane anchor subunit of succinate dehydrogenase, Sdh4 [Marasmius sp. AFHP31]|nr:membrane anchor subunit of succinate dehydrogenase, Sdh4 [Marasmius sp. AFHP31]